TVRRTNAVLRWERCSCQIRWSWIPSQEEPAAHPKGRTMSSAAELPTPPWRKPRRGGRTRRPLSRDLIVETAQAVVRAEGLDAVSMRRVAQELGTGPASLYAHVSDKDELLELVA